MGVVFNSYTQLRKHTTLHIHSATSYALNWVYVNVHILTYVLFLTSFFSLLNGFHASSRLFVLSFHILSPFVVLELFLAFLHIQSTGETQKTQSTEALKKGSREGLRNVVKFIKLGLR